MDIRDLQRRLPKVSATKATWTLEDACEDTCEAPHRATDADLAKVFLGVLALADALGVDMETAVTNRLALNGVLLSK